VLERVHRAEKLPGVSEILIPGQREAAMAEAREAAGTVPIERNMLGQLREMANKWDAQSASAALGEADVSERQLVLLEKIMTRLDRVSPPRFDLT
jgi:hypothetical protein